jgi:DNA invertase Pin-like site-specific DNA recombinase
MSGPADDGTTPLENATAKPIYAAQYVRMSTEHQKYSTENQADIIQQYAERKGFEIVRTYADEGKSGLNIGGREALQRLIADVESGYANFSIILVYDVSRWGRFQDADAGAYYEYICRRAHIEVHYCAEQFENDGSLGATIIKSMKRAMAGEYSRELSVKVFTGQSRLIERGFRQGGPAGYGLRRMMVDQDVNPKAQLGRGEHKSLQTDRVILVPGPTEEIEVVRRIYHYFVVAGRTEFEIAVTLNGEGITTDLGRAWTRGTVHQILINEKYIGSNVWNRTSFKLKQKRARNAPNLWLRVPDAFEGIVDPPLFRAAQAIIGERGRRFSDEEMLAALRRLFDLFGYLSGLIIDEAEDLPSSSAYQHRFGSLLRAYQLVGFVPDRDYRYIYINRVLRRMHPEVVAATVAGIEALGGTVARDPATDLLTINKEFTASIVIARCMTTLVGALRWKIRFDTRLRPDITVVLRMGPENQEPRDYYLFPWIDLGSSRIRLAEENALFLDSYRFESLDAFFHMSGRTNIKAAA